MATKKKGPKTGTTRKKSSTSKAKTSSKKTTPKKNKVINVSTRPIISAILNIVPKLEISLSVLQPRKAKIPNKADVPANAYTIEDISYAAKITDKVKPFKNAYPKNNTVTVAGESFLNNNENKITTTSSAMANPQKNPFSIIVIYRPELYT